MKNVLTWKQVLDDGREPKDYTYSDIEEGAFDAILDFKAWAKKVMAINCYFTLYDTGKKIQLSVFCNEAGVYKLDGSDIDFTTCATDSLYSIKIKVSQKKKAYLVKAEALPDPEQ